mmetsp:Transcript_46948/g.102088  ORF Transcript_46948/g.102088 Transcript_46948/m.102088 type:complete len:289 (+) Transcript_46948:994-1860(+)
MLVLHNPHHVAVQLPRQQDLLIELNTFQGLLKHPAAVHVLSESLNVAHKRGCQSSPLVGLATFQELLNHVVPEHMHGQLRGVGQQLLKSRILLGHSPRLQLLLDQPAPVLVKGQIQEILHEVREPKILHLPELLDQGRRICLIRFRILTRLIPRALRRSLPHARRRPLMPALLPTLAILPLGPRTGQRRHAGTLRGRRGPPRVGVWAGLRLPSDIGQSNGHFVKSRRGPGVHGGALVPAPGRTWCQFAGLRHEAQEISGWRRSGRHPPSTTCRVWRVVVLGRRRGRWR